jgi:protein translocase SecG subunit
MFEFTLKLIWIILSIFLIFIIFSRVPKNQGLTSFATKSDLLGSPNSTESFLNNLTIASIFGYYLLAVQSNTTLCLRG